MMEYVNSIMSVAGWLGLGGFSSVALIAFGIWKPQHLFMAIILAGGVAVLTLSYAKGLHDEYVIEREKTIQALQDELKKEKAARQEAESHVNKIPLPKPNLKNSFAIRKSNSFGGVRDDFDRDSAVNSGPKKNSVQPVESNHLFFK